MMIYEKASDVNETIGFLHVEDCQIELKRIIQKIALYWK
jgi:23S rRNA maturation mini-RNase III